MPPMLEAGDNIQPVRNQQGHNLQGPVHKQAQAHNQAVAARFEARNSVRNIYGMPIGSPKVNLAPKHP